MAAKTIAPFLGVPGGVKVAKVSFGIASDSPDVSVTAVASDVRAVTVFNVPAGTFVTNLIVNVKTALDSTGAFTMSIGDTDADGYIVDTDLLASDAGIKSMLGKAGSTGAAHAEAYLSGRLYGSDFDSGPDSDGHYQIAVTLGTAPINAGLADIYLVYFNANECKVG